MTFNSHEGIMEFMTTQAFTSAGDTPWFVSGFVIIPLMKAILFFAVNAVVTAFSYNSKFLPLNLIAVIIAPGASDG